MDEIVLQAIPRTIIGKQVKAMRREGKLPAIIYGHDINPIPISLDYRDATHLLQGVSYSQLISLEVDGERYNTLLRDRQHHPVSSALLHLDFQAVSLTEKLRTTVHIRLIGEAPAVDTYDGIVVSGQEELEVECLPGDLPSHLEVDLSSLQEIGDALYVRDIVVPPNVELLTDLNELVAVITAQAAIKEEEEEEVEEAEVEPEIIEKGKKVEEGEEEED